MQPCANFSAAATGGNQVAVKPRTSCRYPPREHHGRRERNLWNEIDLGLKAHFSLLTKQLEQMNDFYEYIFICKIKVDITSKE